MSDSENTTENKTDSKVDEATSNLEENKHNDNQIKSSKSNIVIPLMLLLISAIVIIATFYEDEYRNLIAQTDQKTDATEKTTDAALVTADSMIIDLATAEATNTEEKTAITLLAREEVCRRFSIQQKTRQMEEIYEGLIAVRTTN